MYHGHGGPDTGGGWPVAVGERGRWSEGWCGVDLYLLRHGEAVDQIVGGYARDADRPLTEDGRSEVSGVAEGLQRLGLTLDRLLTSPLLRARQTAELIGEQVPLTGRIEICPALAPGGDLAAILAATRGGQRVMLVGHLPTLSELIGWLAWGDASLSVHLGTAGLCRLDLPAGAAPGMAQLRWLLPPRLSRRLR